MSRRTGNNSRRAHGATRRPVPRLWRYEVDEVWGFEDRDRTPVRVGDVLIDRWKGNRTWNVHKVKGNMEYVGGWHAKLLGEYDGPVDGDGRPISDGPETT
jgi:hypothetical protein